MFFPDVVQVSFYSSDNHAPQWPLPARRQQWADEFQRTLHRAGGEQQLRNKILLALEQPAHFVHGRDHVLTD